MATKVDEKNHGIFEGKTIEEMVDGIELSKEEVDKFSYGYFKKTSSAIQEVELVAAESYEQSRFSTLKCFYGVL